MASFQSVECRQEGRRRTAVTAKVQPKEWTKVLRREQWCHHTFQSVGGLPDVISAVLLGGVKTLLMDCNAPCKRLLHLTTRAILGKSNAEETPQMEPPLHHYYSWGWWCLGCLWLWPPDTKSPFPSTFSNHNTECLRNVQAAAAYWVEKENTDSSKLRGSLIEGGGKGLGATKVAQKKKIGAEHSIELQRAE